MKFHPPANENYAATVVRIRSVNELANCDNVIGVPLIGHHAVTSRDVSIGDLYILFTTETQLSEEYTRKNNLHRHSDRNDDGSKKGYLEDNRRIRAQKFRGHTSNALLMPLVSLGYTGVKLEELSEGDTFDTLGDHEICKKYVVKTKESRPGAFQPPKITRVDEKFFPQHFDTSNYFRNIAKLNPWDSVTVTQKLHGTSIRVGHTLVKRKLKWIEKAAKRFGVKVVETEYDYVFGSRKVIKDPNNPDQNHFYDFDLWTHHGKTLEGLLPRGYIVYGELIGYVMGRTPIQTGYTYSLPEGECRFYIYRVTHLNPDGVVVDLTWDQVVEFCDTLGLATVPELWRGYLSDFDPYQYLDINLYGNYFNAIDAGPSVVDEGVCIRREGLTPLILKAKSPLFLEHETKLLDKDAVDIESEDG